VPGWLQAGGNTMKRKRTLTLIVGLLTFTGLTIAGMQQTKPELEMDTFGAQIDQIMSKTNVIADVRVVKEKL